jgi:hypothetical protein
MASPPSAPPSGPGGAYGEGDAIGQVVVFIKSHYIEIFVSVILIYLAYYAIVHLSKFIFKPAYLVDPNRGTKRCVGRILHHKVVENDMHEKEFRAFVKDGLIGPVIPHLYVDMDRVKVLSNAVLLDYRSVVYDHTRRMFVGSLSGVSDMDPDGLAVEDRVKGKLEMIDVSVSMAAKGSPSITQFSMMNNSIPLPDGMYREDIHSIRGLRRARGETGGRGLPPGVLPQGKDHVEEVRTVRRHMRKKRVVRTPGSGEGSPGKRFTVEPTDDGPTDDGSDDFQDDGDDFVVEMEEMPLTRKLRSIVRPMLEEEN